MSVADVTLNEAHQIIVLQADRMKLLRSTLDNFKKDPANRKTKSYFERRLEKIEKLYEEFHSDHRTIILSVDVTEEYVRADSISQFEELYLECYCAIADNREEVLGVPSTSSSNASATPPTYSNQAPSSVQLPNIQITPFSGHFVDWLPFHDAYVRLVHANGQYNSMQKFTVLK